ncbi:kinase-like domain-containing protein [Suillus lakei]|nr:kinase-like domain-containing protein [Suillus lakei]
MTGSQVASEDNSLSPIDFTSQISETLKLESPCNSGSFGVVYRRTIKSSKNKMEVAVKVFKLDPGRAMEKNENTIRRELKVWLRLSKHPTIVPLLGTANVESPYPALVSQWMSSGTLSMYLKRVIAVSAKVELVMGVADGLNYLHSENVVHGDLHPENVLIDGSGNPRLTDFGLATVAGDAELQLSITTVTRSLDPRWRAPEIVGIEREPEKPSFKSDIYSFGGVMFFVRSRCFLQLYPNVSSQIISGDKPWKEKSPVQICIVMSQRFEHVRPDNMLDHHWASIQKCWSWDPRNRPDAAKVIECIVPPQMVESMSDTTGAQLQVVENHSPSKSPDASYFYYKRGTSHNAPAGMSARKNIVLFGQAGAGKSSLVNLMAGEDIAGTSMDLKSYILHWQEYPIAFAGESYNVFDTVGLEEPQLGIPQFLDAVQNTYNLIQKLERQGGIDLLLFCMRAGRLTTTLYTNYRLFHEFLCDKKVPIILVITHLENEPGVMDDWWKRHEVIFRDRGVDVASHACITTIRGIFPHRYEESRIAIRKVVREFTADGQKHAWKGGDDLFVSFMRKLRELLVGNRKLARKNMTICLTKRCGMSLDVAKLLADRIKNDEAELL